MRVSASSISKRCEPPKPVFRAGDGGAEVLEHDVTGYVVDPQRPEQVLHALESLEGDQVRAGRWGWRAASGSYVDSRKWRSRIGLWLP